jgi:Spy/CpxP family protein refolding chaperone
MKNLFLSLIAITTITLSASAQENNSGKSENRTEQKSGYGKKHGRFDRQEMAQKLNFTDEQKQQLKSINENFKSQVQELNNDKSISAEELKEKKQTLGKERMEKVQALLTPDQKAQMEQFRKEGKQNGKMGDAKRMEKMKSTLNLSDEQVTKMKAQREEFKSKAEAIKNNESLSADQKNEQLKSLRDERKNSFKGILTPDQVKKLEEIKHDRPTRTT